MSKAAFLAAAKFKEERIELPGGSSATLRELSGAARDLYEQSMVKMDGGKREADMSNMRAKLIAPCLIDDDTDLPMLTVEEVGALPASVLNPIWDVCLRINGMGSDAADTAAKNSDSGLSAASTSDSH